MPHTPPNDFGLGLSVITLSATVLVGTFALAVAKPWSGELITLVADFRTVSGLSKSSTVQLAGKEIGHVSEINFIHPKYGCDPEHEDIGASASRRDDCDPSLFCVPRPADRPGDAPGECVELDPFSGQMDDYEGKACGPQRPCGAEEVCVDTAFIERNPRVLWTGPKYTCVSYDASHTRVQVVMEFEAQRLPFIRSDSLASIASKGPLGDQMIDISVGEGRALEPGSRVRAAPSLIDDLNVLRARVQGLTFRLDQSLSGLRNVFEPLSDEREQVDLRDTFEEARQTTDDILLGRGSKANLIADPEAAGALANQMADLRSEADDFDASLRQLRREVFPALRDAAQAANELDQNVRIFMGLGENPDDGRAFVDAASGQDFADALRAQSDTLRTSLASLQDAQSGLRALRQQVQSSTGSFGTLVKLPDAYNEFVKLFNQLERGTALKNEVREVLKLQDQVYKRLAAEDTRGKSKSGAP